MKSARKRTIEGIAYGDEPVFDLPEYTQTQFISFLNYYNYNSNHEDFKTYALTYVKEHRPELVKVLQDIPKTLFSGTLGALSRMLTRGFPNSDYINEKIQIQLDGLIAYYEERIQNKVQAPVQKVQKVQKPKNDVDSYIDDVEAYIENCVTSGNFVNKNWTKFILENKIKPTKGKEIAEYFTTLLDELTESDEGYDLTKKDFEKFKTVVHSIVECFGNIPVNRIKRERAQKPIDKNKLVAKVKYLAAFPELNLVSVSPINIIGAKYALLYNERYKKLQLICAKDTLTVRGSTIYGIDESTSVSKTLRDPKIIFNKFMYGDIRYILGSFSDLKTKSTTPTGAINSNTLILRAWNGESTQNFIQF